MKKIRANSNLTNSFNNAIEGFIYILKNEKNMKIHFLIGFFALVSGVMLGFDLTKFLFLLVTIFIVLFAEVVNSLIEYTLDIIEVKNDPKIKVVKDISASMVLVSCILAIVVGYLLFIPSLTLPLEKLISVLKLGPWHVTFLCLITTFIIVVFGKVFLHRGRPLRGGMPSGHSAIAFSVWGLVALTQSNILITILVLMLAILIARSRFKYAIHTIGEIIAGSVLGFLVTLFFYQLLWPK